MLSGIISGIFGFGRAVNGVIGHKDLTGLLSVLGIMALAFISVYLVTQLKNISQVSKATAIKLATLDTRVSNVEKAIAVTKEQLGELEKVKDIIVNRGISSVLDKS